MTQFDFLKDHRAWEDWAIFALGGLTALSPVFSVGPNHPLALFNAVVVGFLIMTVAMSELSLIERWGERCVVAAGIWLVLSPVLLGYGGLIAWLHSGIGVLVACLGALELWQDRTTPRDPAS